MDFESYELVWRWVCLKKCGQYDQISDFVIAMRPIELKTGSKLREQNVKKIKFNHLLTWSDTRRKWLKPWHLISFSKLARHNAGFQLLYDVHTMAVFGVYVGHCSHSRRIRLLTVLFVISLSVCVNFNFISFHFINRQKQNRVCFFLNFRSHCACVCVWFKLMVYFLLVFVTAFQKKRNGWTRQKSEEKAGNKVPSFV